MQVLSLSAQEFQILVPVNMVAQILGRQPLQRDEDSPALANRAYQGTLQWRDYRVPLFDSSSLHASDRSSEGYERMVVLWPLESAGRKGFFALTSLGPPRVLDISDQPVPHAVPQFDFMTGCVNLDGEIGVIPDLMQLSNLCFPKREAQ